MNRKKKTSRQKKKFIIHPFILFFMLVIISIPFILSLVDWLAEQQTLQFSSPDRLIFVQSSSTVMLLVGIPIALIFCFISFWEDKKKKRILFVNKYIFIGFMIAFVGSLFVGNGFYSYTNLDKDGIKARNGLFTKEVEHGWESAESVSVTYYISNNPRSSNNINLHYDLHMANGSVVNLYHSPEFFTHILQTDQFLQGLGIPINRSRIHPEDFSVFLENFRGPGKLKNIDRLKVLEEVFK